MKPEIIKPEILARESVYAGYMKVQRVTVRLADGAVVVRDVERHGDGAAVLPFDPHTRRALIVRLFRLPAFDLEGLETLDEACAGMIDAPAESAADAARREALEELGVVLRDVESVGRVWSSPGVSSERVSLFLASYGPEDRITAGGGVPAEHEGITVIETPLVALAAAAEAGRIADMKLLALIQTLRLRRPDLFTA
jgi:nudix-type nucleoside diphosphatase (YffH/AdpP family)